MGTDKLGWRQTPVLVTGFNRPALLQQSLESLETLGVSNVFVSLDGPRAGSSTDSAASRKCNDIALSFAGRLDICLNSEPQNNGCKRGIEKGLDWFFSQVGSGIILEDDLRPSRRFFQLVANLLPIYEEDVSVGQISGTNLFPELLVPGTYFRSKYGQPWGWATWKDRWISHDRKLTKLESIGPELLNVVGNSNPKFTAHWMEKLHAVKKAELDSWFYPWQFSLWELEREAIVPAQNLVLNLGYSSQATHSGQFSLLKPRLDYRCGGVEIGNEIEALVDVATFDKLTEALRHGINGKKWRTVGRMLWIMIRPILKVWKSFSIKFDSGVSK